MKITHPYPVNVTNTFILKRVEEKVKVFLDEWIEKLAAKPILLAELETAGTEAGREFARLLLAGILTAKNVQEGIAAAAKKVRAEFDKPLRKVASRIVNVQFQCNLMIGITSQYCVPRNRHGRSRHARRGKEGAGIYLETAALGILEGQSPGLRSQLSRTAVLLPSIDLTTQEMKRGGVELDEKSVHAILNVTALSALAARSELLEQWRKGALAQEQTLAGKRVVVGIDAGKARSREAKRGKHGPTGRSRFFTEWRDVKIMTIYVINERGRIDRSFEPVIDVTFLSADHLMELVSMHLYRLGAKNALKVHFVGDGADWIWDRVGLAALRAGLSRNQWTAAIDFYHVMEQLNQALLSVPGWDDKTRKRERTKLRNWLRNQQIDDIIAFLRRISSRSNAKVIEGRIAYLERRRDMMAYRKLRRKHWPIGSGAVESAVRRVINLRIKAPGSFWKLECAEGVAYLRAHALTGRWDELMGNLAKRACRSRSRSWKWEATPCSCMDPTNLQVARDQDLALLIR